MVCKGLSGLQATVGIGLIPEAGLFIRPQARSVHTHCQKAGGGYDRSWPGAAPGSPTLPEWPYEGLQWPLLGRRHGGTRPSGLETRKGTSFPHFHR